MYRSILVHLDDTPRAPLRLDVAVRLAVAHDAQLVGVYLVPGTDFTPFTAAMIPSDIVQRRLEAAESAQEAAEAMFRDAAAHAGMEEPDWRAPAGDSRQAAVVHARYADLAVLGQPPRNEPDYAFANELSNAVVMGSGRPVLFVPASGVGNALGARIMIGWKDTRESARAVADSVPFLRKADQVSAVTVSAKSEEGLFDRVAEKQLEAFLARHGVSTTVKHVAAANGHEGEALLAEAADANADLLVIGGYSRPRIAELMWGGVTRTILHSMSVPVLMSH